MTPAVLRVLDYVRSYIAQNRCAPTYDEIASAMGMASRSHAHRTVQKLLADGHLARGTGGRRNICLPDAGLATVPTADLVDELQRRGVAHG